MGRIRSWYYAQHKAVRIMIQIAALIAIMVLMKIFVAPVCYEAGRALRQWTDGFFG